MKKSIAIILVSIATMSFTSSAIAADAGEKATYKAAKESADAEYKVSREHCNSLTGNPKDVCIEEAKAVRTRTKSEAKAQYKSTASAHASARTAIAEADYAVAKAKCGSRNGNEKDVCIKEAKAVKVATDADSKVRKQVVNARANALDDKREANYKVAMEKCDAFAGEAKEACTASVKSQYSK